MVFRPFTSGHSTTGRNLVARVLFFDWTILVKDHSLDIPGKLMDKLKIAFVTTSYPMEINPASGIFVHRLINHMPGTINSIVITPDPKLGGVSQTKNSNSKVVTFRYGLKNWQTLAHNPGGIPVALRNNRLLFLLLPIFLVSELFAIFRSALKAQIIHANWSINGFIAGIAGMILSRPVITTLRGEDITRANKYKVDRFILGCCIKWSTKVSCVNHSYKNWIIQTYPQAAAKITTIENGVDNRFFDIGKNRFASDLKLNRGLRLLTVGSLIKRKRVKDILKALIELADSEIILTIAGDGPELKHLRQLVYSHSLQNQVNFVGTIDLETLLSLLKTHNAFVLCSESEGRPNALLEAMAAGLPVVSTKLPGVEEIISHNINGLLFEIGDISALQKYLLILKERTELRISLGNSAYNYMKSHKLCWESTAEKYLELYHAVLTEQQRT